MRSRTELIRGDAPALVAAATEMEDAGWALHSIVPSTWIETVPTLPEATSNTRTGFVVVFVREAD